MAKVQNPLMSMTAQKQLGKTLIYKMKNNRAFVTGYNRPGGKNPFSPSESQVLKRNFYAEAVAIWQAKNQAEKDFWNDLAKEQNLHMSGWNLFYQQAFNDPSGILGYSYFGERIYGVFEYGFAPAS